MKVETVVLLALTGLVGFLLYKQHTGGTSANVTSDLTSSAQGIPKDPGTSGNVVGDLLNLVNQAFATGNNIVQSFSKTT